jgi:quinol monooxygenase YgiN
VLIVAGEFHVDPDRRDEYLAGRHEGMRTSRTEPGCLEYTLSADPIVPGRIVLFERWANQEDLDTHVARFTAAPPDPGPVTPTSMTLTIFDISGERPFGS